jgi:hypothetical protein
MSTPFRFDRRLSFAVTPEQLWSTFERTECYRDWWPWLRELQVAGSGLNAGTEARFVIQAPLPYQLRCDVHVDEAVPNRLLAVSVTGDLAGPARLELEPSPAGTRAHLAWTLDVRSQLLRPVATVARPALAWGHDRIVERGLVQFEEHALDGSGPAR